MMILSRSSLIRGSPAARSAVPAYVRALSGQQQGGASSGSGGASCSGSCNCNCASTKTQDSQRPKLLNSEALVDASQALSLMKVGGSNVRFLDATWHLDKARNGNQEYTAERIPSALRFDLDDVCDKTTTLPHMLPNEAEFTQAARRIGLCSDDRIVVYSQPGPLSIASSARVWWTLKAFGHDNVSVLNGGLGAWKKLGGKTESGQRLPPLPGNFTGTLNKKLVATAEDILGAMAKGNAQICDARSAARFSAQAPEPRPGVEGGHVPGSLNLPFSELLVPGDETRMKSLKELREVFDNAGVIRGVKVFNLCGSGVTACVLVLGLHLCGANLESSPVYDGSWSEWGSRKDLPKSK